MISRTLLSCGLRVECAGFLHGLATPLRSPQVERRVELQQPDGRVPPWAKGPVEVLTRRSQPARSLPKEEALYSIGGRYEVSKVILERQGDSIVAALQLHRTGDPLSGETIFFHLLDEDRTILAFVDRCRGAGGYVCAGNVTGGTAAG